jgi:hypothetical protein
MSTSLPE